MATHYVAMAGEYGCLPNFCEGFETLSDASAILADIHELGQNRGRALTRDRYIDLDLQRDGAEYAEIIECVCNHPDDHNDYFLL